MKAIQSSPEIPYSEFQLIGVAKEVGGISIDALKFFLADGDRFMLEEDSLDGKGRKIGQHLGSEDKKRDFGLPLVGSGDSQRIEELVAFESIDDGILGDRLGA